MSASCLKNYLSINCNQGSGTCLSVYSVLTWWTEETVTTSKVKMKLILPTNVLHTIYNSLLLTHFNYRNLAWGSNIHVITGPKLHLLQIKLLEL